MDCRMEEMNDGWMDGGKGGRKERREEGTKGGRIYAGSK